MGPPPQTGSSDLSGVVQVVQLHERQSTRSSIVGGGSCNSFNSRGHCAGTGVLSLRLFMREAWKASPLNPSAIAWCAKKTMSICEDGLDLQLPVCFTTTAFQAGLF